MSAHESALADYHVEFGALCAPLSVQLEEQGLTVTDHAELTRIEVIAKAVATVTIHGLMPHAQSDRARKKLAARMWKIVCVATAGPTGADLGPGRTPKTVKGESGNG